MFQTPNTSQSSLSASQQTFQSLVAAPAASVVGASTQGATTVPHLQRGIVKMVLSGDAIVVRGQPRGGPPPEKQINLSNITAPKLARRPNDPNTSAESRDEPCAWEAREFLRKKLIGQEVAYTVQYTVPATGREYGIVYLGRDTSGENVAESLVSEGLVEVRQGVKAGDEYYQRLNELQNAAKTSAKGKWGPDASTVGVRDVKWTVENGRNFVDSTRRQPLAAVVEHVRDGSTLRAFLLPDFHYVTVMLTGIKCPGYKIEDNKVQEGEPYADEAKYFVESRLLQRDVSIILESTSNQNFIGTVIHPKGNIAEALLSEGFAKCVDWSLAVLTEGAEKYRAAEKLAKEKRLRLWKSYQPPEHGALLGGQGGKTFQAKVVEIVMADALVVKKGDNDYQKIWLSSIRPPRSDDTGLAVGKENQRPDKFRPLFDIPYMFEAREFLRKKLIGKKVSLTVDYVQPAFEKFPEKTCCTVTIGGQNVAEALVAKGLATVIRYAQGNENRSSQYDQLMAAEAKAEKSRKGLHSLRSTNPETAALMSQSKDMPTVRVQDLQGDATKSKQFYPFLQRAGRLEGVVEFVASGSRLRLFVPKETCLLSFLLSGISCPRATRTNVAMGPADAEPFGDEALHVIKEMCLQREIEFEVETMDKAGNFIGYAFFDGKNLSELLVEKGLAKVHQFSASRSKYQAALNSAQERACAAKLNIWTLPENAADAASLIDDKLSDGDADVDGKLSGGDAPPRVVEYKDVIVLDILSDLRFYAQSVDQGPKIERMMSDLRTELSLNPPTPGAYTPRKGDLCAAIYDTDGQWYRAKVETVKGRDRCEIVYIDYGNREAVDVTRLATLPPSFHHIPPGIKEYRLAYVRLPDDPADVSAALEFLGAQIVAAGQRVLLNSEYRANGLEHATLSVAADKRDLGKSLVAQGFATAEPRRDRRLQAVVQEYKQAQDSAKASRLNLWQYGDFTGDEL